METIQILSIEIIKEMFIILHIFVRYILILDSIYDYNTFSLT